MIFIETKLFTKLMPSYLSDEHYEKLQKFLIEHPDFGNLIQGTGGLRKLRWNICNRGKRSGVRIIYYWNVKMCHIYFFTLYAKSEMIDLSSNDKKMLKKLLNEWLENYE
jgi:mRNA-degrading endonuclease RelE of RelBE toxin-antitoxin system